MPDKRKVGYEAFAKWEIELARIKARDVVGRYGFTENDIDDLEQEMLIHILRSRDASDSWTEKRAGARTVMSRILDNRIRDLIDSVKTDKRRVHLHSESLEKEISTESEGVVTLKDILAMESALERMGKRSQEEETDMRLAVSILMGQLSPIENEVCRLIMKGRSVPEVGRILNRHVSSIRRILKRLNKVFIRSGLGEFIGLKK